jgi:DNA-binding beta-propeller fold protein YncE
MKNFSFLFVLITIVCFSCKKSDDPAPAAPRGKVYAGSQLDNAYPIINLPMDKPLDMAMDEAGNLYVADWRNNLIAKISTDSTVSVVAYLNYGIPSGLTVDASGNVYVADQGSHTILKITPEGAKTTVAGTGSPGFENGMGPDASFNKPADVAVDADGNLYVTDTENHVIRKITPEGEVTTYAGSGVGGATDGTLTEATFAIPWGITIDAAGTLYVTDPASNKVRKITSTAVTNVIDEQKVGVNTFGSPYAIAVDAAGNLFVTDTYEWVIRKIDTQGHPSIFFGTERFKSGVIGLLTESFGIAVTESYVFASDYRLNRIVRVKR